MRILTLLRDKDVLSGLTFVALSLMFGIMSESLSMGTVATMGPGLLPLALSVLLGGLGTVVLTRGLLRPVDAIPRFAVRGMAAIAAGLLIFALGVRGAGLGPSVFAMVLVTSLGSRKSRPVPALVLAFGLTAFCWAAFVVFLKLPFFLIGPWFGGF